MPEVFVVRVVSIFVLVSLMLLIACGGGGGGNPPIRNSDPTVAVTTSLSSGILQASSSATFTATVSGVTNQTVTWSVNGIAGGSPTVGVITTAGVYTAPASVTQTAAMTITAASQVDATRTGSTSIMVFVAPRISTRVVNGAGEFYDRETGLKFVPRGHNYVRLQREMLAQPVNAMNEWHTTLSVGLYDSARVETALAQMESLGYNTVKVWMDCCGATAGLGNGSGNGLNSAYLANLADFIKRAKSHHIYVIVTLDDLPKVGGYQQMIDAACPGAWPFCGNLEYTTTGGINADKKFWQDFIKGLVAQNAPMDGLMAYQLREEYYYPPAWQQESWAPPLPLLPTSGMYTAANGKSYNMADAAQYQQCMNESLTYWTDRTRAAIQELAPGALVGVGFVTGGNPYVPSFSAAMSSTADFLDGHTGPGEGTTLVGDFSAWGMPAGPVAKPVMQGEYAARTAPFPIEADAAAALKQWQIDGCQKGLTGWLLWSWDTSEHDTLGFPHWYATRETGLVGRTLSPSLRPDPCAP